MGSSKDRPRVIPGFGREKNAGTTSVSVMRTNELAQGLWGRTLQNVDKVSSLQKKTNVTYFVHLVHH